ncbi:MAG: NAD(P)-binding protein, partial [Lentisphaeria bacterium]|nr:NAD(P)-binding protein [Lentisphaeria bacterium]
MKERQTLVVGSGAGGLTMALLLAKAGRPVTLVESQPNIGGYMRRFVRNGVSFDTGYHFSGGFDDIFGQMLEILGIRDRISSTPISNRIVLKEGEKGLILPAGRDFKITEECFCSAFPDDAAGLHQLFQTMRQIWTTRQMADLTDLTPLQWDISQYDSITVRDFCDSLGLSRAARTAAGSFATCHGTPPSVASMSFHAWIGFCLYDSLSRPFRGGDPMIAAFRQEAEKLGITIRTN